MGISPGKSTPFRVLVSLNVAQPTGKKPFTSSYVATRRWGWKDLADEVFTGFAQSDFSAFRREKQEDARFNKERKVVWKKMKVLQSSLDAELKRRGLFLVKGLMLIGGVFIAETLNRI